ncbi:MAG: SurA N-terminal domain-containing protein, partial [Candidatus Aerophobetes bacterium]|nr:SurA N-terminal domain-containing protein [Candidatus Aerophobetes bacterium]
MNKRKKISVNLWLIGFSAWDFGFNSLTMKIKQKLATIGIISCFLVGTTASLGNSEELIDEVIASVNGKIITEKELENEIFLRESGREIKNKKNLRKIILEQMIEENLLLQEAEKEGLTVTSEMREEIFSDFKSQFLKEEFEEIKK